jgi:hypothetical protein
MSNPTISERKWLVIFATLVVIITSLPYLIGFYRQNEIWRFSGFFFGVEDGNSYIAKMLSGATGSWLFRSPYSAFPQKGFLAFFPYLLLGKLTSQPGQHEQLIGLFQLFRITGSFLMITATYDFISIFIAKVDYRRWAIILATLGGGLGWLSIFGLSNLWQNNLPLEFYSPETFGFLSIYGLPHLAFGRALLLWGFCFFLKGLDRNRLSYLPGILWSISGLFQPINILVGWSVLGAFYLLSVINSIIEFSFKKIESLNGIRGFRQAVLTIFISSPLIIYNIYSFTFDPYLKQWAEQNLVLSPPIKDYFLAYGILIPGIIVGGLKLLKDGNNTKFLIFGWVLLTPIMVNFPVNFQRRLAEGSWVSICILACFALNLTSIRWQIFFKVLFCCALISSVILISGGILSVWKPSHPIYNSISQIEIFKYLSETAIPNEVVLAKYEISNALPAWAPVRVITGHGSESILLPTISELIESSIKRYPNDEIINQLISDFKVNYIVDCNSKEQQMETKIINVIFENGMCKVYSLQYFTP